MNTCANCRHWRPHAGAPTNRVCGLIRQQRRQRSPAHHPRPRAAEACRPPMVLATSKAVSTRRVQYPRTPAHRAVLALSTTYRPSAPESATASERYAARQHPTETAISRQAPSVARREPASTRRVQRPREPARYAPSEGGQEDPPPRSERRPPKKREAACNLTGGQRTVGRVVSTSRHSRLPAAPEGNPEQAKNVPPAGTRRAARASNSLCGTEKYASRCRQPESGRIRQPPAACSTTSKVADVIAMTHRLLEVDPDCRRSPTREVAEDVDQAPIGRLAASIEVLEPSEAVH